MAIPSKHAEIASLAAFFAFAQFFRKCEQEPAFQASSPKNLAGPSGPAFFFPWSVEERFAVRPDCPIPWRMATLPPTTLSAHRFATWLARPLSAWQLATGSLALIAGGTLYCTLYCMIAYPPMHYQMMPASYSVAWATFTFLPWFLALEAAKRGAGKHAPVATAMLGGALAVAAASCSVGMETVANAWFDVRSRTITFQIADQLPALLVTSMAFGLGIGFRAATKTGSDDESDRSALPPPDQIEWITAAGNYVEIRSGSRLLIRRLTMRQAEALLDPARFLRIHRSALVNRDHVQDWRGRTVRMRDGTVLRVGDSHRRKLASLAG